MNNPDSGEYFIYFQDPTTQEFFTSEDPIVANTDVGTMASRLYDAFFGRIYSHVEVESVYYDAGGIVTTDISLAASITYTIKLGMRIDGFSFTSA